jgi:hypothetical protein
MQLTPEESRQVISDIEVLKNTSKQVFNALSENTKQGKENNVLIFTLISKMDKHDVRREYEAKELKLDREHVSELKQAVSDVNARLDTYVDTVAPTMARVIAKHDSVDNFKKSMGTTWGKMAVGLISTASLLLIAYVFGVNVIKFL